MGPLTFFQSLGTLASDVTFLPNSSSTKGFPMRAHASAWLLIHCVRNAWFSLPVCARRAHVSFAHLRKPPLLACSWLVRDLSLSRALKVQDKREDSRLHRIHPVCVCACSSS